MPRLALSPVPPARADADLLVLPVAAGDTGPVAPPVTAAVLELLGANEPGDSVQAALFLREFVAGIPWAHLDIAGPATAKHARYYQPKGASGWGVRTLLAFLEGQPT
jgi:leucyl aminopeptidase